MKPTEKMNTEVMPEKKKADFKQCTKCGHRWATRGRFLGDPDVDMIGYQVSFAALLAGFFLFNHSCKTTLAVQAEEFEDMYDGPIFSERLTGSEPCPGHCLHEDDLSRCGERCECAFVREIIQRILTWPKRASA